jgi:hypothetical protein
MGGAVAQALYVSVLTNKLQEYIPQYVAPAATSAGLPQSSLPSLFAGINTGSFANVEGITPDIISAVGDALTTAYTLSFRTVFYTTIPFSFILIIGAIFVPNMEKYLSQNVAKRLQDKNLQEGFEERQREGEKVAQV